MAATSLVAQVEYRFAWWLWPYLYGLVTVARCMQAEPDWEKVGRMMLRALRVRVNGGAWQRGRLWPKPR